MTLTNSDFWGDHLLCLCLPILRIHSRISSLGSILSSFLSILTIPYPVKISKYIRPSDWFHPRFIFVQLVKIGERTKRLFKLSTEKESCFFFGKMLILYHFWFFHNVASNLLHEMKQEQTQHKTSRKRTSRRLIQGKINLKGRRAGWGGCWDWKEPVTK